MSMLVDNTDGDYLSYASPFDHNAAYTVMLWAYLTQDTNDYGHFFHVGGTYGYDGNGDAIGYDVDGVTFRLTSAGGTVSSFNTGTALALNTWYHLAMVRSSATALTAYIDSVLDITASASDVSGRTASANAHVGNYNVFYPAAARHAGLKIWTAALTTDEIKAESYSFMPQRWSNLWGCYPLFDHTNPHIDYSGNARDMTVNGTFTTNDNPPIAVFPSWEVPGWQGNYTAAVGGGGGNPWYAYAQQ